MPNVKLPGLNIRRNSAGKWYVSYRSTGKALVTGFEGTRVELAREMTTPRFLLSYSKAKERAKNGDRYGDGTLGALIEWYEQQEAWTKLKPRTQSDYLKVKAFLSDVLDYPSAEIDGEDVLDLRDRAKEEKYAKFSNDVIAYVSAVFRAAVDGRKAKSNPALGVKRLYKASEEANRAWSEEEWATARGIAPPHLLPALVVARRAGLRGQDLAVLKWENYVEDPSLGWSLHFTPIKNGEKVKAITIGAVPELRATLDPIRGAGVLPSAPICRNTLGRMYPSENSLRKAWQDFKSSPEFKAALPNSSDLTLHGLRVTYASELRENGFSDREIADMLGDLTESMGKRYARGARMKKTSARVLKKMAENG